MRRLLLAGSAAAAIFAAAPAARAQSFVCDGTTDMTATLNAALANPGAHIKLSAGTCPITGTLNVTANNVSLSGAGPGVTILALSPNAPLGTTGIQIGSNPTGAGVISGFIVSRLTVNGGALGQAPPNVASGDGIQIYPGSFNNQILDVEVTLASGNGVRIGGSNNVLQHSNIHANWLNGVFLQGLGGIHGAIVWTDSNTIIDNRVVYNSLARPPGWEQTHPGQPAWDGIDNGQTVSRTRIIGNFVQYNDIIGNQQDNTILNTIPGGGGQTAFVILRNTVQDTQDGCLHIGVNEGNFVAMWNTLINCSPHSLGGSTGSFGFYGYNTIIQGGNAPYGITGSPITVVGTVFK